MCRPFMYSVNIYFQFYFHSDSILNPYGSDFFHNRAEFYFDTAVKTTTTVQKKVHYRMELKPQPYRKKFITDPLPNPACLLFFFTTVTSMSRNHHKTTSFTTP